MCLRKPILLFRRKLMTVKQTLILFFSIFSLCLSATLQADYTDTWNYWVDASITSYTLTNGNSYTQEGTKRFNNNGGASTNGNYYSRLDNSINSNTGTKLSWGTYNGASSSIMVEGEKGSFETNSGIASLAATFTHANQSISGNAQTPTFMDFNLNFNLQNETTGQKVDTDVKLYMGFYETTNSGSNQDDIFYFLDPFRSYEQIQLGKTDYYLSLFSTFELLDKNSDYYGMAISRLGVADGTDIWGWITKESSTNFFDIMFQVTRELPPNPSVPEPATILILGLAAAGGVPAALRRRMARNRKEQK